MFYNKYFNNFSMRLYKVSVDNNVNLDQFKNNYYLSKKIMQENTQ